MTRLTIDEDAMEVPEIDANARMEIFRRSATRRAAFMEAARMARAINDSKCPMCDTPNDVRDLASALEAKANQ